MVGKHQNYDLCEYSYLLGCYAFYRTGCLAEFWRNNHEDGENVFLRNFDN